MYRLNKFKQNRYGRYIAYHVYLDRKKGDIYCIKETHCCDNFRSAACFPDYNSAYVFGVSLLSEWNIINTNDNVKNKGLVNLYKYLYDEKHFKVIDKTIKNKL